MERDNIEVCIFENYFRRVHFRENFIISNDYGDDDNDDNDDDDGEIWFKKLIVSSEQFYCKDLIKL